MEHISKAMERLEKNLNLTNSDDQEPYILTPEEERTILAGAIETEKKNMIWHMRSALANEFQIESRLKHTDWNKLVESKKEDLFRFANSVKHQEAWHKKQRLEELDRAQREIKEKAARCTADHLFKILQINCRKTTGEKLVVNQQTTGLIKTLCFFFSNDQRFETELGHSFSKGLLLRGKCGLGKSFLIELLKDNELKPVNIKSMIAIADEVKSEGEFYPPVGGILYLDDVGSEEATVNHFGTKINWFKEFIELYYQRGLPFNKLIFSTNNNFQELEQKYGYRVRSRFKQMFNIIDVNGDDLRK